MHAQQLPSKEKMHYIFEAHMLPVHILDAEREEKNHYTTSTWIAEGRRQLLERGGCESI